MESKPESNLNFRKISSVTYKGKDHFNKSFWDPGWMFQAVTLDPRCKAWKNLRGDLIPLPVYR